MSRLDDATWKRIEEHLIRTGVISPEGIGRRAQTRRCPDCRAPILVGLDADLCALRADVDPRPLAPIGEALAQLEGRATYALVSNHGRLVLDYRDAGRITHRPAGTGRHDVMAQHRCHTTSALPTIPSFTREYAVQHLPEGAPCPF